MRTRTQRSAWAFIVAVCCTVPTLGQTTYYVNGDCGNDAWSGTSDVCQAPDGPKRTIQAGIDAAAISDTVIIADGVYTGDGNRDLSYGGRLITVRSEHGPDNCIIDCEGTFAELHRGFAFVNQETREAVLRGVTITNGAASGRNDRGGAGVLCKSSSPTIVDCIITNGVTSEGGGAILVFNDSSPIIRGCTFTDNWALVGGGAIAFGNNGSPWPVRTPLIDNCTIVGNVVADPDGVGGGIALADRDMEITIVNCTITDNVAGSGGGIGAVYVTDAMHAFVSGCYIANNMANDWGGGISFRRFGTGSRSITVVNSTIENNSALTGGAIAVNRSEGAIIGCNIIGNRAEASGGGIELERCDIPIINCLIAENSARLSGGGLYLVRMDAGGGVRVSNCTVTRNTAGTIGAGVFEREQSAFGSFDNCIVWANEPDQLDLENTTVAFSAIQGGWPGTGNIDQYPSFIDPKNADYRLSSGSPCIDAGDNTAVPEGATTDLDGNRRFFDDPNTPDTGIGPPPIVDMGPYEFGSVPYPVVGDMNCDGEVNAFDIEPFIVALFDPGEYAIRWPDCDINLGDINGDGSVNAFDIEPFLELLFGP
jgi:hypothetical protein